MNQDLAPVAAIVPSIIQLARLALQFGRTDRITFHEDGRTPESDTDHTVMLGLVACAFAANVNKQRPIAQDQPLPLDLGLVAQFALVHDLAEALCGDTNTLNISEAGRHDKEVREAAARAEIARRFSASLPWVPAMLERYERLEDPEARFIKVLDKVLPKITHLLNGGATLQEHGVDLEKLTTVNGSQREKIGQTYGADQPEAMGLLLAAHEELIERLRQAGGGGAK